MTQEIDGEELLKMVLVTMLESNLAETEATLFADGNFWKLNISIEKFVE